MSPPVISKNSTTVSVSNINIHLGGNLQSQQRLALYNQVKVQTRLDVFSQQQFVQLILWALFLECTYNADFFKTF